MKVKQISPEQILEDNLEYTLFSWSPQRNLPRLNIQRAEGVYLYDQNGKSYIDFSSQLMNVNIGHGDKRVMVAVQKQMEELCFVYPGAATEVRGKLGKMLAEIAPGPNLKRTFFTLGGAEAIENAIKLARVYTGRHKIITQYRSYHGATMGAMSAGGDPRRWPVDSQAMPNVVHVENPYSYRCPWGTDTPEKCGEMALRNLEQVIKYENPSSVAAILMEGESGSSGLIKYPPFYLKGVREICDKYGILLIDDEVMSGFGRTGKYFAIEHHEVEPDILCMAKGLTAGYLPLGGIMVKEEIAQHFDDKMLPLGLTYSAHPVSCAAAIAVLDIYKSDNLVERAANMEPILNQKVDKLIEKHPCIGDWRNNGMFGCLEIVKNRESREPMAPWNATPEEMKVMSQVAAKIRELGMFTFVRWNWVFIVPPLTITEAELDAGLAIISQALEIADQHCH